MYKYIVHVRFLLNHANQSNRLNLHGLDVLRQAELVNGFVSILKEDGVWVYLAPNDVLKMDYMPESSS